MDNYSNKKSSNYQHVLKELKKAANPKNVAGMARFGINPKNTLGVAVPVLRQMAKEIGKNPAFAKASAGKHKIAEQLWKSGIHEARILASMIDNAAQVSGKQMDDWVKDFDSWDVCDQVCMNLFYAHPSAFKKCVQWVKNKDEFIRRAGFALMACLAFKDKQAEDKKFIQFFPLIKKYATDERNYVRKAVNWALRQIGKRNLALNKAAIRQAKEISKIDSKSARWIAGDALRELESAAVQKRLKAKISISPKAN
ncbi:DNA alkylation repair protein [Patescibacteria group bacterium]|nr:DNA alkylation repair protein [Patescibacteria group bacterium]